jgi:nitrogen fixation NifU-like protein
LLDRFVSAILLSVYTAAVLDHFKNPRNSGDLPDATAVAEMTNPVCGDALRLSVRVVDGRIVDARFKAQGCVTAIACSSLLTELIRGKSLEEARRITSAEISGALGGLPAATSHGAQLACDALQAALKNLP